MAVKATDELLGSFEQEISSELVPYRSLRPWWEMGGDGGWLTVGWVFLGGFFSSHFFSEFGSDDIYLIPVPGAELPDVFIRNLRVGNTFGRH